MLNYNLWDRLYSYLYIERKFSDTTIRAYKFLFDSLCSYFAKIPFTRDNFTRFILIKKQEGLNESYLNNYIKMAKLVDKYLKRYELENYSLFKVAPHNVQTLSSQEIESLLKVKCRTKDRKELYDCLILLLATAGARITEALTLKWSHIDNSTVKFENTKNGDIRIVPIADSLYTRIKSLPNGSEYVFSMRGMPLAKSSVGTELKRRAKVAGIKTHVFPHTFRHSFITEMLKQGVSIAHIARLVGHHDLESTNQYTHLVVEDLRETIYLHPLLRKSLTIEKIGEKLKSIAMQFADPSRYNLNFSQDKEKVRLTIRLK